MDKKKKENCEFLFNVILVGDSGVGKTSIINRFTKDVFIPAVDATIGVEFRTKSIVLDSLQSVKLHIWDAAGHDRLRCLTKNFYRQADAILFVYDVTCAVSFKGISSWMSEAADYANSHSVSWLVGNKIDASPQLITVSRAQSERFAASSNMKSTLLSAKSGTNVWEMFTDLCRYLMEHGMTSSRSESLRQPNNSKHDEDLNIERKEKKVSLYCCSYQ